MRELTEDADMPFQRESTASEIQNTALCRAPASLPSATSESTLSIMRRVIESVAAGRLDAALDITNAITEPDPVVANAKGVCLMRLGKPAAAVVVYRCLVLNPGQTFLRADRPTYFKANYATALLLAGNVDGCLHILHQIRDESPEVRQLRATIHQWETTLSFWQKLDWWINHTVPPDHPISMSFVPGEFGPYEQQVRLLPKADKPLQDSAANAKAV
jgi:hypothetical protein